MISSLKYGHNTQSMVLFNPPGMSIFLPVFLHLTLRQKKMTRTERMALMQLQVIA
jgi:hypothetical protein